MNDRKPPYLKTDIIKSEMIADANADSGTTKSKKKKKSSTINSEDMKVQFTDDLLNPHDEATTTEKLKKCPQEPLPTHPNRGRNIEMCSRYLR